MDEGRANIGPQLGEHASYVCEWVESSLLQRITIKEETPLDLGFFYLRLQGFGILNQPKLSCSVILHR